MTEQHDVEDKHRAQTGSKSEIRTCRAALCCSYGCVLIKLEVLLFLAEYHKKRLVYMSESKLKHYTIDYYSYNLHKRNIKH